MRTPFNLQPDYTTYRGYYQIKLPLEMETMIPADDPVRLLSAFVEGMDLSELYATYDRVRKIRRRRVRCLRSWSTLPWTACFPVVTLRPPAKETSTLCSSLKGCRLRTIPPLVRMIEDYIEYYNSRRLQRKLGVLTPFEKHEQYLAAA